MSIALIASAAALFAAAPATAPATPATPATASAPSAPTPVAVPEAEIRHCVRFQMTGFSPPRRACKSREMWIGTQDYDPLAPRQ